MSDMQLGHTVHSFILQMEQVDINIIMNFRCVITIDPQPMCMPPTE